MFLFLPASEEKPALAGKDTKGILRVHQFDKIEMFVFCKPEDSVKEHQLLLSLEEEIMSDLKIPYIGCLISALVIWVIQPPPSMILRPGCPDRINGQGEYRETHSTSNCGDFQSRRLNIKFKSKTRGKWFFIVLDIKHF